MDYGYCQHAVLDYNNSSVTTTLSYQYIVATKDHIMLQSLRTLLRVQRMLRTMYIVLAMLLGLALSWYSAPGAATALAAPAAVCASSYTVTSAADSGAGSLRDGIATVYAGGTITFDSDYSIYLNSTLTITKAMTIDGSGHAIVLSGDSGNNGSPNVGIIAINNATNVALNYLTFTDGTATNGGGIFNGGGGTVTLNNTKFG